MNEVTFWMRVLDFIGWRKLTQEQRCSINKHDWREKHWYSNTWYEDYPFGEEAIYKVCKACGTERYVRTVY